MEEELKAGNSCRSRLVSRSAVGEDLMGILKSALLVFCLLSLAACGASKTLNSANVTDENPVQAQAKESPTQNPPTPTDRETYLNILHGLYAPERPHFVLPEVSAHEAAQALSSWRCDGLIKNLHQDEATGFVLPTEFQLLCADHGKLSFEPDRYVRLRSTSEFPIRKNEMKEITFDADNLIQGYNKENLDGRAQDFKMRTADKFIVEYHRDTSGYNTKVSAPSGLYEFRSDMIYGNPGVTAQEMLSKTLVYHLESGLILDVLEITRFSQDNPSLPLKESTDCSITIKKGDQIISTDHLPERCLPIQSPFGTKSATFRRSFCHCREKY